MRILALDTSGPVAAVAVAEQEGDGQMKLIGGFRLQSGFTHSQTLMPMLEHMMSLAAIGLSSVDYIAVASGPGSFTGLRIGASCAKGLAFALEKQVVPVPTLDAMAYQMAGVQGLVCPMTDARRSQVYTGVYAFEDNDTMTTLLAPCAIAVTELIPVINRLYAERYGTDATNGATRKDDTHLPTPAVSLIGDGVPVYFDTLREGLRVPYGRAPFHRDRQSAEAVCALAFRLVREGKAVDADTFAPVYLRPSQAEAGSSERCL